MPRKPRKSKTPSKTANSKPQTGNAIHGSVSNSAFVVGENNGLVISGGERTATPDERISAMFDKLLDNEISTFENNYTKKKG